MPLIAPDFKSFPKISIENLNQYIGYVLIDDDDYETFTPLYVTAIFNNNKDNTNKVLLKSQLPENVKVLDEFNN